MRSMLYWPINADDENFLGVLAGWAATLKRMRRHLGFWGCGSEPSLIKTDRCHASVPSNKTSFFFLLSFGFILKNKWRTDTRIQLTLHCCLPVSRNIRTCLQRQDNPAGAPLHSPCQGLCVIMSSSLYIIQPITHHLPDDSNGKKIDWKRFFFFFLLDSIFLAITWATPAGSTSIGQSFCFVVCDLWSCVASDCLLAWTERLTNDASQQKNGWNRLCFQHCLNNQKQKHHWPLIQFLSRQRYFYMGESDAAPSFLQISAPLL